MANQQQPQHQPESNIMEQCLVALTELLSRQNQQPSLRVRIEKELKYLPTFEGKPGTLPTFITSVDRALAEYGNQAHQVYIIIYNEKISGSAKNYLESSPPLTWIDCKAKLKLQYKSSKDQSQIMHEISILKVSTINELLDRIRLIVDDISECAIFSEFQSHIINNLSSMLILKIKELTAGSLAAELRDKFTLEEIRIVINKYIGQDQYNLKWYRHHYNELKERPQKHNTPRQNQNFKNNHNINPGQIRQHNYNPNNSRQLRQNFFNHNNGQTRQNFNNSGQSRFNPFNNRQFNNYPINRNNNNNNNQVQPMEVDTLSNTSEVNHLGEEEFFIN